MKNGAHAVQHVYKEENARADVLATYGVEHNSRFEMPAVGWCIVIVVFAGDRHFGYMDGAWRVHGGVAVWDGCHGCQFVSWARFGEQCLGGLCCLEFANMSSTNCVSPVWLSLTTILAQAGNTSYHSY